MARHKGGETIATRSKWTDEECEVVETNLNRVYHLARRKVGQGALADDLAQEGVFAVVHACRVHDPSRASLSTALQTYASGRMAKILNTDGVIPRPDRREAYTDGKKAAIEVAKNVGGMVYDDGTAVDVVGAAASPSLDVEATEAVADLYAAINDLEPQRREIMLRRLDGQSYREIGKAMGIETSSAGWLGKDAMSRLRVVLAGHE